MPAVTTSSATGSRVLQKPMSADAARSSQDRSVEDPAADGISTKSVKEQQESPGKRSSSSSNNMSSKIKRFPTLLSRKESRSKAETTANGNGNPRSASNGDGRRKSTSGTSPGSGTTKPSTPSHGRSISLAAATPSSLPRPVANAGLPASATSPNLSEQASGNTSQQPLSPTSIAGSPRRVPPPGQESGIPRLVTSARSASGTPVPGRTESNASAQDDPAKPTALRESSAEERVGPLASGSIAGALGSADNHNPADVASKGSPTIPGAGSQLYVVNGSASPDPAASDAMASSEHMSRTSSGSRMPMAMSKTSTKNSVPQTSTSPDTTVPAMWRSNSYEGTAHAYITTSQSGQNVHSATGEAGYTQSTTETRNNTVHSDRPVAVGIEGLRALEQNSVVANNPALLHRIQLLQQLVLLRGESVLMGVDISEIVWAQGTDAHLSVEEEFSRARNGKALSQVGSPVLPQAEPDQPPSSTLGPPKKHGIFDRVTARFGGSHGKPHQTDSSASITLSEASDTGSGKRPPQLTGSTEEPDSAASKRGPVFGTALQDIPPLAMAISIIGGQRHQLPILVFSLVEAIFKRGLETSGIFRMNGNAESVERLVEFYNTWPAYGDDHSTDDETIFTLCEVLKKYLKDLPEPLLGGSLWTLFVYGCLADRGRQDESEHYKRMAAVQIIFRLLPRKNMSLLIYLIAFLYQVSLRPANRLTTESISVIFGPSLLGSSRSGGQITQTMSSVSSPKASSEGLRWLLENWEDSLSQDLLDEDYDCFASPFLGQTAWSTPNLLGEMQSNPFNAASDPYTSDLAEHNVEQGHKAEAISTREAASSLQAAELAQATSEPRSSTTADPAAGARLAGDLSGSSIPAHVPDVTGDEPSSNARSGTRSVSGFAKGEHFSDEDINSDPNAAQLFGSLSQLFTTERRKAKAYQQQVEHLQSQQAEHEAIIKELRASLLQRNAQIGTMQNQVTELQAKVRSLEVDGQQSVEQSRNYQQAISEATRKLEDQAHSHAIQMQETEEQRRALLETHITELEEQKVFHNTQLQEQLQVLKERHDGESQEQLERMQRQYEEQLDSLRTTFDQDKERMLGEIHQLREAVQVSDRERDGARTHLQRIRALLDAAQ